VRPDTEWEQKAAALLDGPGGRHRFVFDPSLFPVGKYRLTVVFDVAEDRVVYLRVYEVCNREMDRAGSLSLLWKALTRPRGPF